MIDLQKYLGAPYAKAGRSLTDGVDCLGLVIVFYRDEFGIDIEDPLSTDRWIVLNSRAKDAFVSVASPFSTGDVVELPREHLGVVVPGGILHSAESCNVGFLDMTRARILAAHRHIDLL